MYLGDKWNSQWH